MKKKLIMLKKWISKNRLNVLIGAISLVAFVIGIFALGFLKSLLIVGGIDLLLAIPFFVEKIKGRKKKHQQGKTTSSKETPKKKKAKRKRIFKILLVIGLGICILGLLAVCGFCFLIVKEAPKFDPNRLDRQEATILYFKDGTILTKLGAQKREKITYEEMPEVFVNAIIATEDSRFFQHNGFDLPRFLKASVSQVLGKGGGGASTITMQVSKNNYTDTIATGVEGIKRKFTDIYMAIFQLEKKYTKKEILEFYVNDPYLGSGAYGVEQAAQTYFGKSIKDVTLPEAAMIAGLFQAPDAYDPYVNPEAAEARRQDVLYLMNRHGYITKEEWNIAKEMTVSKMLKKSGSTQKYQGFINMVVKEVQTATKKDPYTTSMEIYTTLDKEKQDWINDIVSGKTFTWENGKVDASISVIDVKTGEIAAIGSGRGPQVEKGFVSSTSMDKQIGSTAKPLYDYGPGIEYKNWSTYTPFTDEEHTYSTGIKVDNWDGKFEGFMTLRYALKYSRNIPALKAFQSLSNKDIKTFVTGLGLSPELEGGIIHEAHSIGGYNGENPVSMSAAYAAFANGGYYIKPHSYTKIVYRETGETVENKAQKSKAMSPETAYMIMDILKETASYALGYYGNVNGATYGAKTGTTNFSDKDFEYWNLPYGAINDLWAVGASPNYSIAVWYGYDKVDRNYVSKFGNTQHAKLFQAVAKGVFKGNSDFTRPSNVLTVEVEKDTYPAKLPSPYTPDNMKIKELFKKGTEPTEVSDRYNSLEDVKNLNSKFEGNQVVLSWDAIKTPAAIDQESLKTYFKSLYAKEADQTKYLNQRVSYNNSYIGTVGYQVYEKRSDGSLVSLGYTKDTTFTHKPSHGESITYVVKSAYSIFKANISKGAEQKVQLSGNVSIVTSSLNGEATVNLKIGDTYIEPNPSVLVLEDTTDVSDKATVAIVIKKDQDQSVVSIIDTSAVGSYTITYTITYKDYTETLTRKVVITASR